MVSERWVQTLRDSVADAGLADGWSVMNRNGNVQVQHSWLEPGGSRQKATAKLPVVWEKGCTADVISALTVVQKAMLQGRTLKEAVKVIGKQTTLANGGLDWDAAWEQFKCSKIESGQVSDEGGFTRAYGSCWKFLRVAIEEQSPQNASHLLLYSTYSAEKDADGKWIPLLQGSPYRCRKVQIVKVFLEFCCDELGFEERWCPPANTKKFGDVTPRAAVTGKKQKNKKDAVPEAALKPLFDSFCDTQIGRRWRVAIGLLACFGLRPWELKFLEVEGNFLRVTEGKRNSRKQSDPRIVMGIDPEGMPGFSQQLLLELSSGTTQLPALGKELYSVGNIVGGYLKHQPYRRNLRAEAEKKGEVLAAYSFRHRYAYAVDRIGLNDREISQFMGNNRMTYVQHYGTNARESELIAAAERVMAGAAKSSTE